jgi:HAD superfamily phosphoserine phosphatase-like hydrolase
MTKRAVLWDIDGTLIDSSLEKYFLKFLLNQNTISLSRIIAKAIRLTLKIPIPKLYQYKLYYLAGLHSSVVDKFIPQCWERDIKPELRHGSLETVQSLSHFELKQVALSGTINQLAQPMIEHFSFDHLIAGNPEFNHGSYTGGLLGPHPRGEEKVRQAENWLNTNSIPWDQVVAIADHWDDRFILKKAGLGFAMTPKRKLREFAKTAGIEVVDSFAELQSALSSKLGP